MKRGFSFLELILVISIMGILCAVAVPTYINSLNGYRVSMAVKRVAADIEYAREIARRTNTSQTINFSTTNSNYQLVGVSGFARKSAAYLIEVDEEPYHSTLSAVVFNSNGSTDAEDLVLVFDRFGVPDSGGTVTLHCGGFQKLVIVAAATGHVTTQ